MVINLSDDVHEVENLVIISCNTFYTGFFFNLFFKNKELSSHLMSSHIF